VDASLNSAATALISQSKALSTISTNLANSSTSGYKAVSTQFLDLLTSNSSGDSATTTGTGGVSTATRANVNYQGSIVSTSSSLDMAISGNGFFVVSDGTNSYYTRDGDFTTDSSGNVYLNGTNYYLKGWATDSSGTVTSSSLSDINVSSASTLAAKATTTYSLSANLPANGQSSVTTTSYTDASGNAQTLNYSWVSTGTNVAGDNTYLVSVTSSDASATLDDGSTSGQSMLTYTVETDSSGNIVSVTGTSGNSIGYAGSDLPTGITVTDSSGNSTSVDTSSETWSAVQASTGFSTTSSFNIYDSKGNSESVTGTWTAAGDNTWVLTMSSPLDSSGSTSGSLTDASGASASTYSYEVSFNSDGTLKSISALSQMNDGSLSTAPTDSSGNPDLSISWTDGSSNSSVSLNLGTANSSSGLTQLSSTSSPTKVSTNSQTQNGYSSGTLKSVSVTSDGEIDGTYSNGQTISLYKVAVATFINPDGLTSLSDNVYQASSTSGTANVTQANTNGAGSIEGSSLENSTVDTSNEVTKMVTSQQAYSSASQVISTTSKMFEQLVNVWS